MPIQTKIKSLQDLKIQDLILINHKFIELHLLNMTHVHYFLCRN